MKKYLGGVLAVALGSTLLFSCGPTERKLPIYGERSPVEREVDGKKVVDTIYHTIPNFSFLNQDSTTITQDFFKDKIYVTNFFFTHCPSICPTMQRNLLKAYEKYKGNDKIVFLSHSIDFKYDQPSVLKDYATKLGVDDDHWQFVTGSKADIYGIAEKYMVYTKEDANAPGGYDHQGYLVIIDPEKRIRGAYDGTNDEQVKQFLEDLDVILAEYK
ncbi:MULTISPECIES: SCO family protein [Sphingobacterium]|uniref:SCO family protein n=1 Tax=Sphingobacterium TaxID=28453 RepID=UPI00240E85B8|nr:SCO family protein [Sphingobacterium sp. WM]WFB64507.1 SCO family protein [Sphingobacterium sp. WM]